MSQFEQIAVVCNLTKLHLPVSKSLLTQEIWLRVGLIQCTIALDAGLVACGEKLNRSLCSLKIKLFLDAGGGDWGLFDAQFLALELSNLSQSCNYRCRKACLRRKFGCAWGLFNAQLR